MQPDQSRTGVRPSPLKVIITIAILLAALLGWYHGALRTPVKGAPLVPPATAPADEAASAPERIVLVPLDSRPPCRDLVVNSARLLNRAVLLPPGELMDYYSQPGDTAGLRRWLDESLSGSSAAILSIDQLLYGGLLAAREKSASPDEIQALADDLRALHAAHPEVPLYAFSILPRLTPQDGIDGYQERRDLVEYSRLKGREWAAAHGQLAAGDEPLSAELQQRLNQLESRIPPDSLTRYLAHFTENEELNRTLIDLTHEGVLHCFVLGQDDGEPYSIPNIEKENLRACIESAEAAPADTADASGSLFITHGADELGLMLLARYANEAAGYQPRVALRYADPGAARRIMPYMAITNEECAQEKIDLLGGRTVTDGADFTLYINAGDMKQDTISHRGPAVQELAEALRSDGTGAPATEDHPASSLALVDLSVHFNAQETLLPLLIDSRAPLHNLLAYAGWNTASNAIGTALAQASLDGAARRQADSAEAAEHTAAVRTALLDARLLEDYYYLKSDIDLVNRALKKAGYTNTADLDLEHNSHWANAMMQQTLRAQAATLKSTRAYREPFRSYGYDGHLQAYDLTFSASYPWPRTFEINLAAVPFLTH